LLCAGQPRPHLNCECTPSTMSRCLANSTTPGGRGGQRAAGAERRRRGRQMRGCLAADPASLHGRSSPNAGALLGLRLRVPDSCQSPPPPAPVS
jgi:hypothetical protein